MAHRQVSGRSTSLPRLVTMGLIASVVAVVMLGTTGAAPVLAAEDELRETVLTTYRVDPGKGVVHVTLDITVTNLKPDTPTTIYYYNTLGYAIHARARSVKATSNGATLNTRAVAKDIYTEVTIRIPNLYHNRTRKVRLAYDLPGGAPRSETPVRVGRAHAEFSAFVWGDAERADIRIVVPDSFSGDVQVLPDETRDPVVSTRADGLITYSANGIGKPDDWYALVNLSDREALTDVRLDLAGKQVTVHAWPEDKIWLDKVSTVLEAGFPALEAALGQPWPVGGELDVTEVSAAEIRGYAGIYDASDHEIQISEALDEHVIVHEAAHAWFDRSRFVPRWISEGLADEYASRIVSEMNGEAALAPDRVTSGQTGAFRLNAWPPPSRIDAETSPAEDYGYNASWMVIRSILGEVTEARMRDVFDVAAAGTLTYVGAGPAESSGLSTDWRGFLDLVEDVGGSTNASDLFETWVVTDSEKVSLAARRTARADYADLVEQGDGWLPGVVIRKPMGEWKFDQAEDAMDSAEAVLVDRDGLRATAAELGLGFPTALEPAYELADSIDDLSDIDARIDTWVSATEPIRAARDALAVERSPLVALGLYGTQADAGYAAALGAWAAGDDVAAVAGASATLAALAGAAEIGRSRVITAGVAAIVAMLLILLLVVAVVLIWRRLHRRQLAAVAGAEAPDPYATLAATPNPVEGAEVGWDGGEGAQPD